MHLRGGENITDLRCLALASGLEDLSNVRLSYLARGDAAEGADLVIQTGFGRSTALLSAIEQEIPYIIMEAPYWRHIDCMKYSSWGWNGLAGGAWRPKPTDEPRPHPELQPWKNEGNTIIFGQKPTDHSLRGTDHVQWILDKMEEYPDAEFRPHPLMVPTHLHTPLKPVLDRCLRAITFNSTVGAEALIAGCYSHPEDEGSTAWKVNNRHLWLHELSYGQYSHKELENPKTASLILSGYEEAESRAKGGLQEIPRLRVDGRAVCARYYSCIK